MEIPSVPEAPSAPIDNPLTPEVVTEPVVTEPVAAAPVVPEVNPVSVLSEQYGLDLNGFKDEESALAAVRLITDQYAKAGLEQQYQTQSYSPETQYQTTTYQTQVPAAPAAPVVSDFNFDDADLDPKVAAGLKALQARLDAATKAAENANNATRQMQEQAIAHQKNEITKRASRVIDGLASPKYGSGANRTAPQQMAVNQLFELANVVIAGMTTRGVPVPTIEKVMSMVVALDGGAVKGATATGVPGAPAAPAAPAAISPGLAAAVAARLEPRTGGNFPPGGVGTGAGQGVIPVRRADDPLGIRNDPGFKAGMAAIMARHK